jgi:ribonucleoside-diphosphate reductase alpha chain
MNFSVKKINKKELVYDIQVGNTHTFTVGKSRMVVHNCFLPYLDDSAEGLVNTLSEVNWLSMLGGGVGIGLGIRSADDKSVGIMPHLRTYDASSLAYRQGRTRRGSYAAYLDISHPDVAMFLEMRKPTGDQNMRCLNLHHGLNITDDFMQIIEKCMLDNNADDSWELKDPHSGEVRETVSAKELWQRILEIRMQTGEPYILFLDTANKHLPEFQKKLGLSIKQSNLCLTGDCLLNVVVDNVTKTIRMDDVISMFKDGKNVKIESKNLETGNVEYKQITNAAMTAKNAELMLIEDEATGKSIRCTPDHKIYTKNRGYVMAKELKEDDVLDML